MRRLIAILPFLTLVVPVHAAPVDADLLQRAAETPVPALVLLADRAELAVPVTLERDEKGRRVLAALTATAARSQEVLVAHLEREGLEYRAFWIANVVAVTADAATLRRIAGVPGVDRVVADAAGRMPDDVRLGTLGAADVAGVERGVQAIGADQVWNAGVTGEGVVVASIDTGVDYDHVMLRDRYRGWNGSTYDHERNWWDGVPATDAGCPGNSPEPCDDEGHGTHVTAIMVGDDGADYYTGVAPGAKWIACRAWEPNQRTYVSYLLSCLQYMLAPTDAAGNDPDPAYAPDVIVNSWMCEPVEGCPDVNVLRDAFEALHTAGVMCVAAAGNDGPACSSVKYPPAIYDKVTTVGAVGLEDWIAGFSSRGPVTADGSDRVKPDVCAPGVNVTSANTGGGYAQWSGTSMAAPHVAGAAALLLAANPALAGQVETLESLLVDTAVRKVREDTQCGNHWGGDIPNVVFGWGRIDVHAAYQAAILTPVLPGDPASGPGAPLLGPNVPNPLRTATRIPFALTSPATVDLAVFDVAGRRVRSILEDVPFPAGDHVAGWDGRNDRGVPVPRGIYFLRLATAEGTATRRMVVAR